MNTGALILIYGMMLAFDLAVLAGTAFLIAERGWSAWWMALAFVMCLGSYPGRLMKIAAGDGA
jgi:hypothetical protein